MFEDLEIYLVEVIKGRKKGILPFFLKLFLHFLSWGYKPISALRNWFYDRRWVKRYSPPVSVVISIGNIVAGGTGKTPVTLMIAREFYPDIPLAILSRGYRSKVEKLSTPITVSSGQGPIHPASFCGDEPYMIAQNLPKAFVFVGRDRHKSSHMAFKAGAKVILLDDGMQHRALARDFEVVVMDACDPFGRGFFLPRGFLRESLKSLSRADLIILNHVHDPQRYAATCRKISRYTKAPLVAIKAEVEDILDFKGNSCHVTEGVKVGLFCGIAHPDYFQNTVRNKGMHVVASLIIPDHKEYDSKALENFALKCKDLGAELLICTEKDRVKLDGSLELALPVAWVKMKLVIVDGFSVYQDFIKKAKADLARKL